MKLTNTTQFPPGGYRYKEPKLGWEATRELALMGLDYVVRALQTVRAQNPDVGLSPSYEACWEAVAAFTCKRLNYDPKFCGPHATNAMQRGKQGCAGCGKR